MVTNQQKTNFARATLRAQGLSDEEIKARARDMLAQKNLSEVPSAEPTSISTTNAIPFNEPMKIAKPTVATADNPVVEVLDEKRDTMPSADFSDIESMNATQLEDYIDALEVKQIWGQTLSSEEILKARKAARLFGQKQQEAQQQQSAVPSSFGEMFKPVTDAQGNQWFVNVKTGQIVYAPDLATIASGAWSTTPPKEIRQPKTQAEVIQEQQRLLEAEENRLQRETAQQIGEFEVAETERLQQEIRGIRESWRAKQQAIQSWLSFSGFGRSTLAAEKAASIAAQVQAQVNAAEQESLLQTRLKKLELEWASDEILSWIRQNISQLQSQRLEFISDAIAQTEAANQESNAAFEERVGNLLTLAEQMQTVDDLTEEEIQQAWSYAELLIDSEGNVDKNILEQIPDRLRAVAIMEAAKLKGAISTRSPEYWFTKVSDGVIAVTNPDTGEVEFKQIWKTGGTTNITGYVGEIGSGKVTAYGTEANPFWLDIDWYDGQPLWTTVWGTVVEVWNDPDWYWNYVVIQDSEWYRTRYAHMWQVDVNEWDVVSANTPFGTIWTTGNVEPFEWSDWSHVDITVFDPQGNKLQPRAVESYLSVWSSEPEVTFKNISQSNSYAFGVRSIEAQDIIRQIEDNVFSWMGRDALSLLLIGQRVRPWFAESEWYKLYDQAQRNFVNAVLRKESGAQISNTEFESAAKQYFVQPWDTDKVIEQKRRNRQTVIETLQKESWQQDRFDRFDQQPKQTVEIDFEWSKDIQDPISASAASIIDLVLWK